MKVVALIPAYNCENTIAKVVLRAMKYVDLVIVYDDGSTDDTLKIAEAIGAEVWGGVKNRGKGFALSQLFQKAKKYTPQAIVTLDADGQHIADEKYDKYSHVKNPIGHFLEVFNFFFLRRPLLNLGSLGLIGFVIGLWKIWEVINTWNLYRELAIGTFLFSMLAIILSALAFFAGIILHVILSERKKI